LRTKAVNDTRVLGNLRAWWFFGAVLMGFGVGSLAFNLYAHEALPFRMPWWGAVWAPFAYFGLVAVLYYLWLATRGRNAGPLWASVTAACAAGTLGSLWFWVIFERWYFSVIHGVL